MNTLPEPRLQDAKDFGRVGLLLGGDSAEREVSLNGGADIARAFDRLGIEHEVFDGAEGLFEAIANGRIDRVFNLMHGPGGEDGAIQGALQLLGVPITGSGLLGSALTMDKIRSKWVMEHRGIATAPFIVLGAGDAVRAEALDEFTFPVFVKPAGLGSSIGVSRVTATDQLDAAVSEARRHSDVVLIEQGIEGGEYFAGIIGRTVLPLIRIETPRPFYDYAAKYTANDTRYHCPAGLDPALEQRLQALSLEAFDALGAAGWARVDFILDANDKPWFLEVNTAPGMTDHSLVPQAAAVIGVGFDELVWRILETSL